ncbi:phytoene desaturase family protein [Malacoplasma iowae]|uniref:phytoene desaturase family protein n=1 Tax=Malacoplasma iowae TaxID=2116 RepID=UPI002A18946B|nr:NAD(P)/FAD-dependent oxidoreductase [Malacoplasma iowae]WPL40125.1 NAD(P)/FAD-dependent oxidoreductase [Malacoplasma iowae]
MNTIKYDAVVIGAGNGGLVSATRMAKYGMKVLLVEQHNVPGGFASSFVRGRFEFEPALHELGAVGNKNNPGYIYQLFDELGVNDLVTWHEVKEAFTIVLKENNQVKEYSFPFGREAFARKLDEYDKGCYKEVLRFIDLCTEIYDAFLWLEFNKGKANQKELKQKFPNFLSSGSYTLKQVLNTFKLSKFAKNILSAYWTYLGEPPEILDFTLYGVMFSEYINYSAYIPGCRSHEISSALVTKFQEYGGEVWFNTKATKIVVENYNIKKVITTKGEIETNIVIANCSPNIVYGELIDKDKVPPRDNKLVNFRKLNKQGFSFYIGLNIRPEDLKLKDYSYFMYSGLNQDRNYENIKSIEKNNEYIVVILNNVVKDASPDGTCIMSFTTLYEDAWNDVKDVGYFKTKEKIAYKMIKDFEEKMNVNIMDHIEEIEIATPITFARYTGVKNGVIYGYSDNKSDAIISRSKFMDNDINVKNLFFAGGYSFRAHGYSTTYKSGDIAGKKAYGKHMEAFVNAKSKKENTL